MKVNVKYFQFSTMEDAVSALQTVNQTFGFSLDLTGYKSSDVIQKEGVFLVHYDEYTKVLEPTHTVVEIEEEYDIL